MTLDDIESASADSGLWIVGSFPERITGKTGLEIALPHCDRPLGLFPVRGYDTEISPTAFGYQSGPYTVSYVYGGQTYSEAWISYKLNVVRLALRALSVVENRRDNLYSAYLKIWTPSGCAGLTPYQAAAILRRKER
jgi:hypothetical protein